jgi:hypothetical protein
MATEKPGAAGAPVRGGRFFAWPSTKLGWWSVALAAAFVVLMAVNGAVFMQLRGEPAWYWRSLLVGFGMVMLGCGLGAGILGVTAVVRQRERSGLVWLLPILAGLFVVFLLVGEFLVPH